MSTQAGGGDGGVSLGVNGAAPCEGMVIKVLLLMLMVQGLADTQTSGNFVDGRGSSCPGGNCSSVMILFSE